MWHSKRPPLLIYQLLSVSAQRPLSPVRLSAITSLRAAGTCSPLTCHPSPRSGGASGYQNRVHRKHEYLIICPQDAISNDFLSDRLSTWGSTARRRDRSRTNRPRPYHFITRIGPAWDWPASRIISLERRQPRVRRF